MPRTTLPHILSGWSQTRLFPPEAVELQIRVAIERSNGASWHIGASLVDEHDTTIAIESVWLNGKDRCPEVIERTVATWVASALQSFEPF